MWTKISLTFFFLLFHITSDNFIDAFKAYNEAY